LELCEYTAHELWRLLSKRQVSSREIVESVLSRIQRVEDRVGAYIRLMDDMALAQADEVDSLRARGEPLSPLAGIPIALKDNICTTGIPTTCGSRMLELRHTPVYDATVVSKLKRARTVLVGKTNMDEFAMGSSTENSAFFTTRNPWQLQCVPGGTSGGSAAAVAASETVLALGSDTGGSVRQPASFCSVVGLKPTYGRVSRYGLVAHASSLDQIGPLTKDVTDCALLLHVISGHDPRDSTSAERPVPDYTLPLHVGVKGLRVGRPREYFGTGLDQDVHQAVEEAIRSLGNQGAEIVEVSLPHTEYAIADYYIICMAEASSNLGRYDGLKYGYRTAAAEQDLKMVVAKTRSEGFGDEVKRRIMLGTYALSAGYYDAYYDKAQRVRMLIKRDYDNAFQQCDVLACPVSPFPAFAVGEKIDDPLKMYLADIYTVTTNLAGIPAMSIPCGFSKAGLPIGLQLKAPLFQEELLLRVAYAFESSTDHHLRKPSVV